MSGLNAGSHALRGNPLPRRSASTINDWPGAIIQLHPAPDPRDVFLRLAHLPHCVFFDSALRDPALGRYSFVAADPFEVLSVASDDASAWSRIEERLHAFSAPPLPDLPPFQGGLAGLFSYELSRSLERLPCPRFDDFGSPGIFIGCYDVVVALDHASERAWIISQGFPERDPQSRHERAESRAEEIQRCLSSSNGKSESVFDNRCHLQHSASPYAEGVIHQSPGLVAQATCPGKPFKEFVTNPERVAQSVGNLPTSSPKRHHHAAHKLAPQFPVGNIPGLTSNFSRDGYLKMVERAIEYIFAGDVFQVNLAQRLLYPAHDASIALYLRLRDRNPATFAAYFDAGDFQIVSASPERFLHVRDGLVETRPIKGTRPRGDSQASDEQIAAELLASEKDRAENIMIVDLLRNDLSRVCRPDSVRVRDLCRLERYAAVQHLVSVVEGQLQSEYGPLDLLKAAFPGGSVTGAPKVRAMEIIAELEPTARGPYCGALGYIGFDGTMDTSILIRTITAAGGHWQSPVGGGIVAQSDPLREYEETWHKAEGLLRALL